ncbi:MAG: TatD family hydrolase [Nitrososphaerota archaeon]|nr:TatD family hydrolase [Candidatus Bathyarchaeota archaeon]MDW8048636.1 TatD family hydrolase [Nitrososphaerota archaeon]
MELVDTHSHLEEIEDLDAAIRRAEEVGVIAILTMGSDKETNMWSLHEGVKHCNMKLRIYPCIGLHPQNLEPQKAELELKFIEDNIRKAYAIGEIGLDYWHPDIRKSSEVTEFQRRIFRRLLKLSKDNDKPVSIHSRGAWAEALEITKEEGVKKAVFHWFSGPLNVLKKLLDEGYYISATPAAAYRKAHRTAISKTPLEQILLETDSPVEYLGEPAEPAHITKTLSAVAEIKNEQITRVAEVTTENAKKLFKIP